MSIFWRLQITLVSLLCEAGVCVCVCVLIFAVIAPLCLQDSAQVLLSLFHFPNTFRISGKLQPSLLWAVSAFSARLRLTLRLTLTLTLTLVFTLTLPLSPERDLWIRLGVKILSSSSFNFKAGTKLL